MKQCLRFFAAALAVGVTFCGGISAAVGQVFPQIRITRDAPGTVRLDWWPTNWQLQATTELPAFGDPVWSDVSAATPHVILAASQKQFFRALSPDGVECTPQVVGYVNLSYAPGTCYLGNPLNGTNNHLNTVMPLATNGSQNGFRLYRWNSALQQYGSPITWAASNGWTSTNLSENYLLNPGEGVVYENPLSNSVNVTFVGTVWDGPFTNRIAANYSLLANPVPVTALISQLGFPSIEAQVIFCQGSGQQVIYQSFGGFWDPTEPIVPIGGAFFVFNPGSLINWSRNFSVVCPPPPPQITQPPQSQSVLIGNDATFSVNAIGRPPLSYRWFFAGNPIAGANSPSFTRFNAQPVHNGNYSVVVSNIGGAVTSAPATLKVYGPVVINEWMANNTGIIRDPADNDPDDWFELYNAGPTAVNLGGFRLTDNLNNPNQFMLPAGVAIPAGGFMLFWADNEGAQGGNHVNFTLNNNGGTIGLFDPNGGLMDSITYSNPTPNLSLGRAPDGAPGIVALIPPTPEGGNPTVPIIVQQPTNRVVDCYGTATFTVQAVGALPLAYQWRRNGCDPVVGGNSPTLTISNATLADVGSYTVTVSNALGRATSDDAALIVIPSPVIPRLQLDKSGSNMIISWPKTCLDYSFEHSSDLNSPIDWSHPGQIVGGNSSNYSLTLPLRNAQGFFRLSTPGTRILASPRGRTATIQETVVLSVVATGAPPITYQWQLNGRELPNQTNSTLAFDVIGNQSYGIYEALVEGPDMRILSEPAILRPAGPETVFADRFADRKPLPANQGSLHGNTFGATPEPNEPVHAGVPGGQTVWFSWRPTNTGVAVLDTIGSGFDTVLAVYVGPNLPTLATLASDDDSADYLWSRVQFNVSSNVEYQIAIDGVGGAGGFLTVNWFVEPTTFGVPVIVMQPRDAIVRPNQPAVFSIIATNPDTAPLSYQWFRNDVTVPGQSGPDFVIPSVKIDDVADYYVIVGNAQRFLKSHTVSLQMLTGPTNLQFVTKLNFDFLCGNDTGNIPLADRKVRVPHLKLLPSSAGSLSSSLTSYSVAGSPPYVCKSRTYKKWVSITSDCAPGQSSTMTFDLSGSGNRTTLAGYYITTDRYLDCDYAQDQPPDEDPVISFTAEQGKTYRVIVGRAASGTTITLNYTNGPCF